VIEAGALAALAATKSGRIGVIGTPTTINSNAYAQAIHAIDPQARLTSQACALFVPLVEEGWLDHPVTRLTAQEYLRPVLTEDIDSLVLGCTHYPLLKPLLQEVAGPGIKLVDSANAMAESAAALLTDMNLHSTRRTAPEYHYWVTDVPLRFQSIGERFMGRTLNNVHVASL
jgi:glutamate racemase